MASFARNVYYYIMYITLCNSIYIIQFIIYIIL